MKFSEEWYEVLKDKIGDDFFFNAQKFVDDESKKGLVFPPREEVYSAYNLVSPKDVKVVYDFKNLKNSKAVYCYEDNIVFGSITDVINYYQYDSNSIYIAMCKYNGSYLGKHFVYLKDLPSGFEYKKHTFSME